MHEDRTSVIPTRLYKSTYCTCYDELLNLADAQIAAARGWLLY